MITHSGEKPNKCKQCDFASSQAGHLRTHLKKNIVEKRQQNAGIVINKPDENAGIVIINLTRPGTLVKPGFLFVEATWFKQCKLVKPRYLCFQRLLV